MRQRALFSTGLAFALSVASLTASGCLVPVGEPTPSPTVVTPAPSGGIPVAGGGSTTGTQALPGYRVLANASASMPSGDYGFVVTANGQGGYRVAWTDTTGSSAEFHGSVTTDVGFDANQVSSLNGAATINISAINRIDFDSIPGSDVDGIDLVSTTDPIYLDARVDGQASGFGIYFIDASTGVLSGSAENPVAFSSP